MGCHPRIETNEHSDFITSRTRDSRLWFVNNESLEHRILGLTAKYATRRTITLYGFAIEGNHLHIVAHVASHELGPTFGGSDPTNLDPPLWV
jgi:hypothetical protein